MIFGKVEELRRAVIVPHPKLLPKKAKTAQMPLVSGLFLLIGIIFLKSSEKFFVMYIIASVTLTDQR